MTKYLLIYTEGDCPECGGQYYSVFTHLELMTSFIAEKQRLNKSFSYYYACEIGNQIEYTKQKIVTLIPKIKQL